GCGRGRSRRSPGRRGRRCWQAARPGRWRWGFSAWCHSLAVALVETGAGAGLPPPARPSVGGLVVVADVQGAVLELVGFEARPGDHTVVGLPVGEDVGGGLVAVDQQQHDFGGALVAVVAPHAVAFLPAVP